MMTSNIQRLVTLRSRYDHLLKLFAMLPQLDGASEQFLAEREGRLDALGEAAATLAQIPDIQPARRIIPVIEVARDRLLKVMEAYRLHIQDAACEADAWRAQGALPTLSLIISEVESVLPKARRSSQTGRRGLSGLSYRRVLWVRSPVPCVLCHLPSLTLLPGALGGHALCIEHLSPLLTEAAASKIERRLDALLENKVTLSCVLPLSAEVLRQDMEALQRYYIVRLLLAEHREKDALAYRLRPNGHDDQQSGLRLHLTMLEGEPTVITMEVLPTILHRLVLLDLAEALSQSDWVEGRHHDGGYLTAA